MKTNKTGPGRPKYQPAFPKGRFTMNDFCEVNGVNLKTGKGKNCSKLTLIKFLKRDKKLKGKSQVVQLKGEFSEPNSKDGLGRKAFLFVRRSVWERLKVKKTDKATNTTIAKTVKPKSTISESDNGTTEYEKTKAAILAPAVTVPTPAPTGEPVAETTPAPAEVTEPVAA